LRTSAPYFEPGFEYQIKLAIANIPCIPWTEVLHEFTVTCCGALFPSFNLSLIEDTQGMSLVVSNFSDYPNTSVTHEWLVLSSPNATAGPYTLVGQTSSAGSAPFTVYDDVQGGLYYTVVHRINSPCGQFCYGRQRYADNGFLRGDQTEQENCELCGYIDCSLIDNLCLAPHVTSYNQTEGGIRINWDQVPGADYYIVEITVDDADCCGGSNPYTYGIATVKTSYLTQTGYDCFSFRVAAVCEGRQVWSEPICITPHRSTGSALVSGVQAPSTRTTVYPNPVQEVLNLRFSAAFSGTVQVVDVLGRTVITEDLSDDFTATLSVATLNPGLYWVITVDTGGNIEKTLMVKD